MIDLDFTTAQEAESFLKFLRTRIGASAEAAPALVGTPHTKILEPVGAA